MNVLRSWLPAAIVVAGITIQAQAQTQELRVSEPLAGYHGTPASTVTVRWTGLPQSHPVRISKWSIKEGRWSILIDGYKSDSSQFDWHVPYDATTGAFRIKVEDIETGVLGISDSFFYLEEAPLEVSSVEQEPSILRPDRTEESSGGLRIFPNPTGTIFSVQSAEGAMVSISLVGVNGEIITQVKAEQEHATTIMVPMPPGLPSGWYLVRVRFVDGSNRVRYIQAVK